VPGLPAGVTPSVRGYAASIVTTRSAISGSHVPRLHRRPALDLRWLVVLVPAAVVLVLELLSDSVLDEALPFPWDTLLVTVAVLAIGVILARLAFGRIDALTGVLRARNTELEARGASARALHRVSVQIAALTDVDLVLEAVVTHARDLLTADVAVLLLEDAQGTLEVRASAGRTGAVRGRAVHAAEASVATGADAILAFVDAAAATVRLSAPLQRGGQTIGLLAIGVATPRGFDADEIETLASLANQATIALEHARLEDRLRELAVIEERERIARELHDGIAQVLGYVNTKSQAVDGYLANGRVDEARTQVAELGAAARAVYVDVREAILGLRSPLEPGQGLGAAVEAHARRAAQSSHFVLELAISPEARDIRLEPGTEAQLYRIVQEALTNVRKHAAADRARLSMEVDGGRLQLRIEDDGRGLHADAAPADVPHYGLRSMRERAAEIGATLEVADQPEGGVRVSLALDLSGHTRGVPTAPEPAGPAPTATIPAGPAPATTHPEPDG
jgi:signal transduction histidine kinase